ncbi:DUF6463 family protein [Spongiactinospora sp. 9N601]|uniref:DUF6463 family protein n=1 Tax=Spongiactinospora sp. 9N601 TaxID=3375149 RepID=UPI0037B3E6C6
MVTGVALLAVGTPAAHIIRTTGRLPAQLGWYMVVLGVALSVIYFPVSGGWPLLAIGVLPRHVPAGPDRAIRTPATAHSPPRRRGGSGQRVFHNMALVAWSSLPVRGV